MKKLLILFLLLSLTGCSSQVDLGAKKEKPVKVEKLKASKDKILKVQDVDECVEWKDEEKLDCKKTKKVKQYHYISDKKVGKQKIDYKGVELEEDINKRTNNSVHFKIPKDDTLLGAGEVVGDEYVANFYAGDPYIDIDGEWYQTEVATTTIENYNNETSTTTVEIISLFLSNLIKTVKAVTTNYNPTSSSMRGMYKDGGGSWTTARSASTGTGLQDAVYVSNCGGPYAVRSFASIDTSGIPDTATIESAFLSLYINSVNGTSNRTYGIYDATPSDTTIVLADFNNLTLNSPTSYMDTLMDQSDFTGSSRLDWNEWNSTGLSAISKTSYTKFVIREASHDVANVAPTSCEYFSWRRYGLVSPTQDPYLSVTYSDTPATSRRTMIIN